MAPKKKAPQTLLDTKTCMRTHAFLLRLKQQKKSIRILFVQKIHFVGTTISKEALHKCACVITMREFVKVFPPSLLRSVTSHPTPRGGGGGGEVTFSFECWMHYTHMCKHSFSYSLQRQIFFLPKNDSASHNSVEILTFLIGQILRFGAPDSPASLARPSCFSYYHCATEARSASAWCYKA